jgi:MreB/Mbl protein
MEIKGRSLIEGMPEAITVDDSEIREALSECVSTIVSVGAFRRHQRPRHRPRRRRCLTEKSGQANPERSRVAGIHRRRPVVQRGVQHRQDSQQLQTVAEDFGRIDFLA